jgi:hypothetical protein
MQNQVPYQLTMIVFHIYLNPRNVRHSKQDSKSSCFSFLINSKTFFFYCYQAKYASKVLCNSEFYVLKCFPSYQIRIAEVLYGSYNGSFCSTNTTCVLNSKDELSGYCDGKNACSFVMQSKYLHQCRSYSNVYQIGYYCQAG